MGNLTNFSEAELLRFLLAVPGESQLPAAVQTYIGLFTDGPNELGGGTEVATTVTVAGQPTPTGYVRQPAVFSVTVGDPTVATNQGTIAFNTALQDFGTVTHAGIFDAAGPVVGNLLAFAELASPVTIDTGEQLQFSPSSIQIRAV